MPETITFKVEGIAGSQQDNDVNLIAAFTFEGNESSITDKVTLTVVEGEVQTQLTEGSNFQEENDITEDEDGASSLQSVGISGRAAVQIQNFPPLITYNSTARRTLTVVGIPGQFRGKTVIWKISGSGQIRGIDASDSFGNNITRPVDAQGKSVVIFRATAPGRIRLELRSPTDNKLVMPSKMTVAFTLTQLAELDHQMNHVPNTKWSLKANYLTISHPAERKKLMNTLFYTQEPKNNRVELRLSSTFLNSGKTTWWRFSGNERNAAYANAGYYDYHGKLVTDANGTANLQFTPRAIGSSVGVFTDFASGLYTLSIGADSNGDGKPDHWVFPQQIPFRLEHVSMN